MRQHIAYFPAVLLELQNEVNYHPKLADIMATLVDQQQDFYMKMAHIAAYCNVALDGYYTEQHMEDIGKLCLERLRARRGINEPIMNVSEGILNPKIDQKGRVEN